MNNLLAILNSLNSTNSFQQANINGSLDAAGINDPVAGALDSNFWFGGKNADGSIENGVLPTAIGGASAIGNLALALKQYNLGQDQLALQRNMFNTNLENQRTLTNQSLADRDLARRLSGLNPTAPTYI